MRRCAGYVFDRQSQDEGWKTYYAVDVDTVTLYMAPDKGSKYAEVFGNDEDADTPKLLARLIGDFIFHHLASASDASHEAKGCLFVIPPHDEELGRMIFALSDKLIEAVAKADLVLMEVQRKLQECLPEGNHDELSQWLIDSAPALIEIFDGKSGPRSELDRFESLEESRLLHIERYMEKADSWTFPLPLLEDEPDDLEAFTQSYEGWKMRLLEFKTPKQTQYGLTRDAYVMAMVEWLNQRMLPEKRRLVFITGTHGILDAAAAYRRLIFEGKSRSFSDLYVRHPQTFMADNSFFPDIPTRNETGGTSNFNLFEWLNLFFPRVLREGVTRVATVDTALLEKIEQGADTKFQEAVMLLAKSEHPYGERSGFPHSMLDEWSTQIRSACLARDINRKEEDWPKRAKELLLWIRQRFDEGWTVKQLQLGLGSRAMQSLSALYASTVWLGLWSRLGTITEHVRGVPALRFDAGYEPAQEYCRKVIAAMKAVAGSEATSQQTHIDIAEMYSHLAEVDGSNYHGHVIHALAYATKGHWYAARTLCKIALRTVDEIPPDKQNYRVGREAAYLLAISERRMARNLDDLNTAQQYLDNAQSRENTGTPIDPRFRSETIALDVARVNFKYFINHDKSIVSQEFQRIWLPAMELYGSLESESLPDCKAWIRQQLSTNLFSLALISCDAGYQIPEEAKEQVRLILATLRAKRLADDSMEFDDQLAAFIFWAATAVFSTDAVCKTEALVQLRKQKFLPSLPFDTLREKAFRNLAEQYAAEPPPAGSDVAVAAVKSAIAAANSAYDSMNKAAKQVAEIAEANVAAATSATVKAVGANTKASKSVS